MAQLQLSLAVKCYLNNMAGLSSSPAQESTVQRDSQESIVRGGPKGLYLESYLVRREAQTRLDST